MHYRQRIRDAIAERLATAETLAGPNVFTSRARPILEILQKREAVLSVYTADESSQRTKDGRLLERTLTASVEAAAGGGDDLDDVLDRLAEQVEAAINADPTLGNLLSDDMELTATTSEITARGNQQVGAFRMDFECKYLTPRITEPAGVLPTQVFVNSFPGPDAYRQMLQRPDSSAPESVQSACEDGSCDVPAWSGDPA
jgi:hypothetical protein